MSFHIVIVILLLLYIMLSNTTEGHTNLDHSCDFNLKTTSDFSSQIQEVLQSLRDKTYSEIGVGTNISNEDINEYHRQIILKANLLSEYNNQNNSNIINNQGLYSSEILEMLNVFSNEIDEEIIQDYDGDKDELRRLLENKKTEEIERYGHRLMVLTKKYLDNKYKELESSLPVNGYCIHKHNEHQNDCSQLEKEQCESNEQCIFLDEFQKENILIQLTYYRGKLDELDELQVLFNNLQDEKTKVEQDSTRIYSELTTLETQYNTIINLLETSDSIEEIQSKIQELKEKNLEYQILDQWTGWELDNERITQLNEMKTNNEQCDLEINKLEKKNLKELNKQIADNTRIQRRLKILEKQLEEKTKKTQRKKKWNHKPSGVLYTHMFPKDESNHYLKCINNLRKRSNDNEACNKKCRNSRGCRHVWQYSNFDRCCFKTRHTKRKGFRRGRRIKGWYTDIRKKQLQ